MEKCDFTKEMPENLDMGKEEDKLVLWRKQLVPYKNHAIVRM